MHPSIGSELHIPSRQYVIWLAARALQAFEQVGRPFGRARAHLAYGRALLQNGQARECIRELDRAQQILCAVPDAVWERLDAWMLQTRGEALHSLGDADAAVALERADQWFAAHEPYAHARTLRLLSKAHSSAGRRQLALSEAKTAEQLFKQHGDNSAFRDARRAKLALLIPGLAEAFRHRIGWIHAERTDSVNWQGAQPHPNPGWPGLRVSIQREGVGPIVVNLPEQLGVCVCWNEVSNGEHVPKRLDAMLMFQAPGLDVEPPIAKCAVFPEGVDSPVKFRFTPVVPGTIEVHIKVIESRRGYLLQEVVATLEVEAADRAIASP
jgi:hypothetical protein